MKKQNELLKKFLNNQATNAELRHLTRMLVYPDSWNTDFRDSWNDAPNNLPPYADKRIWGKIIQDTQPQKKAFPFKTCIMAVACSLTVVLGIALYSKIQENKILTSYNDTTIRVEKGQKASVSLPDGTQVSLNSESKITYGKAFNTEERTVTLSGEAYFNVAHNKQIPFHVKINNVIVTALGTKFNIRAYESENKITTYLSDGKVNITAGTKSIMLNPGEKADYMINSKQLTKKISDHPDDCAAWMKTLLVFDNMVFADLLQELERSYNVHFIVKDHALLREPLSGTLKNNNLINVMEVLGASLSFRYKYINNNEIVIMRK